jgi:hypothetical protein
LRLWANWSVGSSVNNQTCTDFYFDVVRQHPDLGELNAFEVLDALVNYAPLERAL